MDGNARGWLGGLRGAAKYANSGKTNTLQARGQRHDVK